MNDLLQPWKDIKSWYPTSHTKSWILCILKLAPSTTQAKPDDVKRDATEAEAMLCSGNSGQERGNVWCIKEEILSGEV